MKSKKSINFSFVSVLTAISLILCTIIVFSGNQKIFATETSSQTQTGSELTALSFKNSYYEVYVYENLDISSELALTPEDFALEDGAITYETSDSSIASVDENGNVVGITAGETTVYAKFSETVYASATIIVLDSSLPINNFVESKIPDTGETILTGFTVGTSVEDVISELSAAYSTNDIQIKTSNGEDAKSKATIATGMQIFIDGAKYFAVIIGDANGDGAITFDDTRTVVKFLSGELTIPSTPYEYAVKLIKSKEISNENIITIESALLISRHIAGSSQISQ